jgi:hypothetical protein
MNPSWWGGGGVSAAASVVSRNMWFTGGAFGSGDWGAGKSGGAGCNGHGVNANGGQGFTSTMSGTSIIYGSGGAGAYVCQLELICSGTVFPGGGNAGATFEAICGNNGCDATGVGSGGGGGNVWEGGDDGAGSNGLLIISYPTP